MELTRLGLNRVSILTNVSHAEAEAGCEAADMSLWSGHSRAGAEVSDCDNGLPKLFEMNNLDSRIIALQA